MCFELFPNTGKDSYTVDQVKSIFFLLIVEQLHLFVYSDENLIDNNAKACSWDDIKMMLYNFFYDFPDKPQFSYSDLID